MTLRMAMATLDDVATLGPEPEHDQLMALLDVDGALDLDKMWDAVRSLFDDGPDPILAGEAVTEDLGYGPATFVTPQRVREIVASFGGTPSDELERRFSPAILMARGAYPAIWDRPEEMPEVQRQVVILAEAVIELYRRAESEGRGIFVALL
jgi:hypothetical protein